MKNTLRVKLVFPILLAVFFQISCDEDEPAGPITDGKIKTEEPQKWLDQTVTSSGGVLKVNEQASGVEGMEIEVKSGAYSESRKFTISTAKVTGHEFGERFSPASPLIHIENEGGYSDEPMLVRIPYTPDPGKFTMAVMYDPVTGQLEGFPPVSYEGNFITIATRHFDLTSVINTSLPRTGKYVEIILTSMDTQYLHSLELNTGFVPGVDDWEYTNFGTMENPGGICAGMSTTAMWYYDFRKKQEGQLYGKFDAVTEVDPFGRDAFWFDNTQGILFASRVQSLYITNLNTPSGQSSFYEHFVPIVANPLAQFRSFAYMMVLTGQPQYISVHNQSGSHALVVYGISQGKLKVSDPNWPTQKDREIVFDFVQNKFMPYLGFVQADGTQFSFTKFYYCARSAIIDYNNMNTLYANTLGKKSTKGIGCFPNYQLQLKDENTYVDWPDQWSTNSDTLRWKLDNPQGDLLKMNIYDDQGKLWSFGDVGFQLLNQGEKTLGVYIQDLAGKDCKGVNVNPSWEWSDFRWVKVNYQFEFIKFLSGLIVPVTAEIYGFAGNFKLTNAKGDVRTEVVEAGLYNPSFYDWKDVDAKLKWTGLSFVSEKGKYVQIEGKVSPDGKLIEWLTIDYKGLLDEDFNFRVVNIPLKEFRNLAVPHGSYALYELRTALKISPQISQLVIKGLDANTGDRYEFLSIDNWSSNDDSNVIRISFTN